MPAANRSAAGWERRFLRRIRALCGPMRGRFTAPGQAILQTAPRASKLAQWALQNDAADALSAMALRFAKGGQELAKLVREQQDLLGAREAAYRSLDAAAGKADAKAAEAARAAIADIEAKLTGEAECGCAKPSPIMRNWPIRSRFRSRRRKRCLENAKPWCCFSISAAIW